MAATTGKKVLTSAIDKVYQFLKTDSRDIGNIYVLALISGLVQLSVPVGIQAIIGFVMASTYSTSIILLIVLVVLGVFFSGLLQVRQMQLIEKIEQKLFVRYSFEFADRLPKLNIQKLDSYYLPELVNRFFDTPTLQKGMAKLLLDIPAAFIQIILGLLLLSFYHPIFIAFGLLLVIILIVILRMTAIKGMETSLRESDYKYAVAGWLEEIARAIKTFKYSKGTSLHIEKNDALTTGYLQSRTAHFQVLLQQYWSLISFKVLITGAMLIVGSVLLVNQQLNIGQFIAAEIVILTVINAVEKFIVNLDKVYDILTAAEKLGKVTSAEIEHTGELDFELGAQGVAIEFTKVSFSYPGEPAVIKDLDLKILPGEHVAITGASGSGKSTLLRLLTGAFPEYEGSVTINNIPIKNYRVDQLRANTGILLSYQDVFKGTLLENLTMGNPKLSLQETADMVQLCGLMDFVKSAPDGYSMVLDPAGKRLPKVIVQKILLIRALLGKERLILLEEPTRYMDEPFKTNVLNYIRFNKDITVLISTNDKAEINACDRLIELTPVNQPF
jgi:ABC-type bacteriocin/lantibiotic exporter with double-glycine peptidase domain